MPPRRRVVPRQAKPFDAALKELVGLDPAGWLTRVGVPPAGPVSVVPTDLAGTVLVEADQVLRVGGSTPWLVQLEFQASRDPRLASRLHLYSTLLERRHRLPVQSVAVLLRPKADAPARAALERGPIGRLERRLPRGRIYLTFEYEIMRIWQQPVDAILDGPLATLPLATLAQMSAADAARVLGRIEQRVRLEAMPALAERLRAATYLLLGLRYPEDMIDDLLRGVGIMAGALKESSTYQMILREGRAEGLAEGLARGRTEEARRLVVRLGSRRFGPPDAGTSAALDRLSDPEQLELLADRVLQGESWADLGLAAPAD